MRRLVSPLLLTNNLDKFLASMPNQGIYRMAMSNKKEHQGYVRLTKTPFSLFSSSLIRVCTYVSYCQVSVTAIAAKKK